MARPTDRSALKPTEWVGPWSSPLGRNASLRQRHLCQKSITTLIGSASSKRRSYLLQMSDDQDVTCSQSYHLYSYIITFTAGFAQQNIHESPPEPILIYCSASDRPSGLSKAGDCAFPLALPLAWQKPIVQSPRRHPVMAKRSHPESVLSRIRIRDTSPRSA